MCKDCPPERCGFCERPITLGQPFARVMTIIYTDDHAPLKEHWQDFHHDPGRMDEVMRSGASVAGVLVGGRDVGLCLWLSEEAKGYGGNHTT